MSEMMPAEQARYKDAALDASDQIETEEAIAYLIFDVHQQGEIGEHECGDMGRAILRFVLLRFAPGIFDIPDVGTDVWLPDALTRIYNDVRSQLNPQTEDTDHGQS